MIGCDGCNCYTLCSADGGDGNIDVCNSDRTSLYGTSYVLDQQPYYHCNQLAVEDGSFDGGMVTVCTSPHRYLQLVSVVVVAEEYQPSAAGYVQQLSAEVILL